MQSYRQLTEVRREQQSVADDPNMLPPVLSVSVLPEGIKFSASLNELAAAQGEILRRGGYDSVSRQFPWLSDLGIAHQVVGDVSFGVWEGLEPNFRVALPGATLTTFRFVAALFGDALDQAAVGVELLGSATPGYRGLRLEKPDGSVFDVSEIQALGIALHERRGVGFELSADCTAVEIWDYADDGLDLLDRVVEGVCELGYSPSDLSVATSDRFLVQREEYRSRLSGTVDPTSALRRAQNEVLAGFQVASV